MLGCRTPFSFCLYSTFLSNMHSREQGPQSSVCMPVHHTLWLDQLYCFILVSLVVVFVAVYNATNILNQWRHLALTSEIPGANSSITSETVEQSHKPDNQIQPRWPIRALEISKDRDTEYCNLNSRSGPYISYRAGQKLHKSTFFGCGIIVN